MRWTSLEDNKVVQITGEKFSIEDELELQEELCPKEILTDAMDINWDQMMILGTDHNGDLNVLGTLDTVANWNLLLDKAKFKLIEMSDTT